MTLPTGTGRSAICSGPCNNAADEVASNHARQSINISAPEEAIREAKRALELDPLSLIISKGVGTIYYYARQHDEAIEQYRNALELAPDFVRTRFFLGLAYQAKEMFEEAAVEFQRAIELSGEKLRSIPLPAFQSPSL